MATRSTTGRTAASGSGAGGGDYTARHLQVLEGLEAIRVTRDILGATSGLKAAAGTIRGDFSSSRQMNLVHASDGPEAAAREIALYFQPHEICSYEPTLLPWFRASDEG